MQADATIADLCDAAEGLDDLAEARLERLDERGVHKLRVTAKRLRAAWRWIAWELEDDLARRQQVRIRDLGRLFSGDRDAAVLRQLEERFAGGLPATAAGGAGPSASTTELAEARRILSDDRAAWQTIRRRHGQRNIGEQALRKAYKRARRDGGRAVAGSDAAAWHDWRKNVKTLLYQIELLFDQSDARTKAWVKGLRKLAESLGDYHDLAVYSQALAKEGRQGPARVQTEIDKRADQLARKAGKLYGTLFDKRPKRAVRRLR